MTAELGAFGAGGPAGLTGATGGLGAATGGLAGGPAKNEETDISGQLACASLSETTAAGSKPAAGPGEEIVHGAADGVAFDFNPEKITISRNTNIKSALVGVSTGQIQSLGDTEIGIDKIIFAGPRTQANCSKLLKWSTPQVGAPGAGGLHADFIWLLFQWGTAFSDTVYLQSVTVTYQRFARDGTPTRAEVNLKMYKPNGEGQPLPSANPTSGGPPGRSTRVLDSSGCLASLAYATYDRPGSWRLIARANGIDDPLRVRPGTVLYLPQRELSNGAGGSR